MERVLAQVEYGGEPGLLVVADADAALERGGRAARRLGRRVVAARPVDGAAAWLARHCGAVPVLAEVASDGAATVELLDRLREDAESGLRRSVVCLPAGLIDLAAARAWHDGVLLLCDPGEAEIAVALAVAAEQPDLRLHDIGRGEGAVLLQQLSEEVGRIANILASLSEEEAAQGAIGRAAEEEEEEEEDAPALDAAFVRGIIRVRRLRDHYLRGGLFADPAWDMLLDLMAARLEKSRVAVSSLCIAAAVPATTALRWIKALTDRGLLVRVADPADGRRVYIELSDETARSLAAYLRAARRISQVIA